MTDPLTIAIGVVLGFAGTMLSTLLPARLVGGAIQQFLRDVDWHRAEYLVIDLPPGTGDAQLTLTQSAPLTGAVIVTTPQDVALLDAHKGLAMFQEVDVPVLGIVENMAHYRCPECGHVEHVFGSGGGQRTAEELGIPLLASIPLDPAIVAGGDSGNPAASERPDSPAGQAFMELARTLIEIVDSEA